jgi:hypothetical protein
LLLLLFAGITPGRRRRTTMDCRNAAHSRTRSHLPRQRWLRVIIIGIALSATTACGTPVANDDGGVEVDGSAAADAASASDAPPMALDAAPPVQTRPSSIVQTSGGGAAASANYQLELRIGAPQPAGEASSAQHGVRIGPGATH